MSTTPDRLLLEVRGSSRAPAELPRAGVLVVGSDSARAGFVVTGAGVDAAHCAIARAKGGGFAVRDLGSRAGTLLNGKNVSSARLRAGDVLRLGSVELAVVDPAAPVSSTKPAANVPADEDTREVELDTPASENVIAANMRPGAASASASAELPTIGGYRVERVLGRGGMGRVFLAVQESLSRQVALKVLAPKLAADREFVRRFQAEARAAAALNHPNVVTVYDVGEDKGTHFLSMEYMDRGNLEERVTKEGKLSFAEVLDVLRDAAQGLAYAEARGIVHRDLKPANLMRNSVGQTKIADLGLATHVESEEGQSADKKVFGTPHFMSPEQARGEKVDGRSDLYSLGATAYRLLSGHTPFEGQSAKDIVRAHLSQPPRPLRDFVPDMPEAAVGLVARLMQKEPAARFASASELLREIDRLKTAAAAPPPRARAKSGGGGKFVFALLVLGGAGYFGWRWYQEQEAKKHPPQPSAPSTAQSTQPSRATDPQPAQDPARNAAADPNATAAEPADAPSTTAAATGATATEGSEGNADAPRDSDESLQLAEANARIALLELLAKDMPPGQKRDELRLLAGKFRGTTAANEAREKSDEIGAALAAEQRAQEQNSQALDDVLTRLRTVAGLDKEPPEPGKALLALRAISSEPAYTGNPMFAQARKEMERQVTQNAVRYADRILAQCDYDAEKGDFDSVQRKLTALMPLFDVPDFALGEGPAGIEDLYRIGRSAREKLKNLELTRGAYLVKQRADDVKAIATSFGGAQGLEGELRKLDLAAAQARLASMKAQLSTDESKKLVGAFENDVRLAKGALDLLQREFSAWRRKSVVDPRDAKGATRNAVGADAVGVLYEAEGGKVEHLGWPDFAARPADVARLFTERLTREYTAEELQGIAALVRMSAVLRALDLSAKMLDPARKSSFTDGNARDLLDAYEPATAWAQKAGSTQAAQRELEAARQLVEALQQMSQGSYSSAVATIEGLLASRGDTLLVSLLSDGSDAAKAATNAAPPKGDAPPQPAADPATTPSTTNPAAPPATGEASKPAPVEPPKTGGDPPHRS